MKQEGDTETLDFLESWSRGRVAFFSGVDVEDVPPECNTVEKRANWCAGWYEASEGRFSV